MVYPDEAFASWLNENFVAVRIDLKKEAALSQKYGVIWAPWLVVIDENESKVAWTVGPFSASDYRMWIEGAADDARALAGTLKMLPEDPENADMNLIVGRRYLTGGDYAKAVEHLKKAVKGLGPDRGEICNLACVALGRAAAHTEDDAAMKQAMVGIAKCGKVGESVIPLEKAHVLRDAGKFKEAADAYQQFLVEFGKAPLAPEAYYWLGVTSYQATHKPEGLTEAWQKLIAASPDDPWARRASMTMSK